MSTVTLTESKKNTFKETIDSLLNAKVGKFTVSKFMIPLFSIIVFLFVWYGSSTALYKAEAGDRVANAVKSGNTAEAEKVAADLNSARAKINGSYEEYASLTPGEKSVIPRTLPSPFTVKNAAISLWKDYQFVKADKRAFIAENAELNAQLVAAGENPVKFTGRPTFITQLGTSIKTVFVGVLLALFIAAPIGIVVGLNDTIRSAFNWIIQIFKPVSPVVWFLLVNMIVMTLLRNSETNSKAFIVSAVAVALCSMWATLVNTAVGVANVDKDYMNVADVLRLNFKDKIFKIVLPSAIPLIFTGLRITVSVAWMVLIAIELLSQSPGLGVFVWDEFQNGATDSNAKIIVAMFVIGIIGFALDRIMLAIQNKMSFA